MRFHRMPVAALTLIVAVGVLGLAGCSSDDDGTPNPNPGGSDTTAFTDDTAEQVGLAAAQQLDDLFSAIPDIASGDITAGIGGIGSRPAPHQAALEDTAVFNPADTSWTYSHFVETAFEGDSTYVAAEVWAQFLTAGVAQEDKENWDSLKVALGIEFFQRSEPSGGSFGHELTGVYAFDVHVEPEVPVTDETGPFHVSGTGYSDYQIKLLPIGTVDILPRHTYEFHLTGVEAGTCASGEIMVDMGAYLLTAMYDGTGTVAWTLTKDDVEISSGTYDCGLGIE